MKIVMLLFPQIRRRSGGSHGSLLDKVFGTWPKGLLLPGVLVSQELENVHGSNSHFNDVTDML